MHQQGEVQSSADSVCAFLGACQGIISRIKRKLKLGALIILMLDTITLLD